MMGINEKVNAYKNVKLFNTSGRYAIDRAISKSFAAPSFPAHCLPTPTSHRGEFACVWLRHMTFFIVRRRLWFCRTCFFRLAQYTPRRGIREVWKLWPARRRESSSCSLPRKRQPRRSPRLVNVSFIFRNKNPIGNGRAKSNCDFFTTPPPCYHNHHHRCVWVTWCGGKK